LTERFFSSNIL